MSLLDRIGQSVADSGLLDGLAENARQKTIQELPLQGKYWYYAPADDEAGIGAEYGLTYSGLQVTAVILAALLAVNVFSKGK